MLFEVQSSKSLDQIATDLETAATRHNFGILMVHDLQGKLREKGVELKREVRIFEVCNPKQAKKVLDADPSVSTALPCRISVYRSHRGYTLSTMKPTEMMKAFEGADISEVAQDVENTIVAMMEEAAE